jgi:hypothetical protein
VTRTPDSTTCAPEPDFLTTPAPAPLDCYLVCNLVIEMLADHEAELLARVTDLEQSLFWYREIVQTSLAQNADLTLRHELLTRRLRAVLDDVRELREHKRKAA